ncbi:hypothetical protein E7T09_12360 [Deinococcus sp. KSM4-11]|uniref:phospholipase D-like domain-containing protein n=1 Tax=Deinococcus sp. KSM4-11 TaxID=2568654 RepID=UPI0010A30768|nr:phospholipase D-like domain-containing protein [Deinococcus sp. KSM4-11]THF86032.1 hypothetical protein E7T09_12360 [Deinococcus sp. KSM4-11]
MGQYESLSATWTPEHKANSLESKSTAQGLQHSCPICDLTFDFKPNLMPDYEIKKLDNLSKLVGLAINLPPYTPVDKVNASPLALILEMISSAENFINFTTWNMDSTFLTALHIASQRVKIRGIISRPLDPYSASLYKSLKDNPNLKLVITESRDVSAVHTKLMVIDGLVIVEGSASLSVSAFEKVSGTNKPPGEKLVVSCDSMKVIGDNNKYFSTNWKLYQKMDSNNPRDVFDTFWDYI